MGLRAAADVRKDLLTRGISIAEWSRSYGFNPNQVFNVLAGRNKGLRGKAHEISVLLGLKNGVVRRKVRKLRRHITGRSAVNAGRIARGQESL